MKPKHQRLRFVLLSLVVMAAGAFLLLRAFSDNLVFFYTPTQWLEKSAADFDKTRELRIGGLVKKHSVKNIGDGAMNFTITDLSHEVKVTYRGMVPSLFREGQGVVAQGSFDDKNIFHASTILAKHDERYMPKQVVDQLKRSGRWKQ